jgi:hypothetical protein
MNINFIDEDGEVLQLQAVANMETFNVFDRHRNVKAHHSYSAELCTSLDIMES